MFLKCKTEIVGAGVVLIYDVVKSASIAESQNVWDRAFSSLPSFPPLNQKVKNQLIVGGAVAFILTISTVEQPSKTLNY